jgi:hypothetical protein
MTRWYSTMCASDTLFLKLSCSVYTTMSLWLYDSTFHLKILPLWWPIQIKRKNDQTVLKYGKSTSYLSHSSLTFLITTVEPPAPMVCNHPNAKRIKFKPSFLVPRTWPAHHNHSTRLWSLRNIQTSSFFHLLYPTNKLIQTLLSSSSSVQPTWVSPWWP